MVNYSKHNQILSGWTGASEARKLASHNANVYNQMAQVQSQWKESQSKELELQQKNFEEAEAKTKAVLGANNFIGETAEATFNSYKSQISDKLKYYNGDVLRFMDGGGRDLLNQMSKDLSSIVPQDLYKSILDYQEKLISNKQGEIIPNSVHEAYQRWMQGEAQDFSYGGMLLTELAHPGEGAIKEKGKAQAYLEHQDNKLTTRTNYALEYGLDANANISDGQLLEYISRYYSPGEGEIMSATGLQTTSTAQIVSASLDDLSYMYNAENINQLYETEGFGRINSLLNYEADIPPNKGLAESGYFLDKLDDDEITGVLGGQVLQGKDSDLIHAHFGDHYIGASDDEPAQILPGRVVSNQVPFYDANGDWIKTGHTFERELIPTGTFLAYSVIDGDKRVLLTDANEEKFHKKSIKPVLVTRFVHQGEDKWHRAGRHIKKHTDVVFAEMPINAMSGTEWDAKLGRVGTNVAKWQKNENQIAKTRHIRQQMENSGFDTFKSIAFNSENLTPQMKNTLDSQVKQYSATFPLYLDGLSQSGIDNVTPTVFSHLMAAGMITEYFHTTQGNVSGMDTAALITALCNGAGRVNEVRQALTSVTPEAYLNIFRTHAEKSFEKEQVDDFIKLITIVAPMIEPNILELQKTFKDAE